METATWICETCDKEKSEGEEMYETKEGDYECQDCYAGRIDYVMDRAKYE